MKTETETAQCVLPHTHTYHTHTLIHFHKRITT
jgi:hypothetical protein